MATMQGAICSERGALLYVMLAIQEADFSNVKQMEHGIVNLHVIQNVSTKLVDISLIYSMHMLARARVCVC